jgi:subtilisin-like proprotein convertase family protein
MKLVSRLSLFVLIPWLMGIINATGATSTDGIWEFLPQSAARQEADARMPRAYRELLVDRPLLASALEATDPEGGTRFLEMTLPMPDGTFARFSVQKTDLMAPALAARYPEIQTYIGRGIDNPLARARFNLGPGGFHGQVLSPDGTVYIDPASKQDLASVITYYNRDHNGDEQRYQCLVQTLNEAARPSGPREAARSGSELRTFRLAVSATAEYTTFHGGPANTLDAIVTVVNRVTGIYELEFAIRFQLVANNDWLLFTDAQSDPFTNTSASSMLSQNQTTIDTLIGADNYDVGHVFATGGGGLATVGSAGVNGIKARGVSGFANPLGDPFAVSLVAHELGHQFGGSHTFNGDSGNCAGGNRTASSAYEPGSGSTIMAYAGICGNDNLQNFSDPYFHSASFDDIIAYVDLTIPQIGIRTATGNSVPTVDAGPDYTIPARTPFQLEATGSDPDGNGSLTYNWEQRDLGPALDLSAPDNGSSPLFRSFSPTTEASRTFPRLSSLLNNTPSAGETLPSTNRDLNFRVTVRDNQPGGGGVDTDDMTVTVVDTGSPFAVTSPNTAVSWPALSQQTVTWDVAGTTGNGINVSEVAIKLSTDGGLTFPLTLRAATPNDGTETISIPNLPTTTARLRLEAVNNIFFDVSDQNFTIAEPTDSFVIVPDSTRGSICNTGVVTFRYELVAFTGFNDPVVMTTTTYDDDIAPDPIVSPALPGNVYFLTVATTQFTEPGEYTFDLTGISGAIERSVAFTVVVVEEAPAATSLTGPPSGTTGASTSPEFAWTAVGDAESYRLEVDADPTFGSPLVRETGSTGIGDFDAILQEGTPYYWRVFSINACGETVSSTSYFVTGITLQESFCSSPGAPIPDGSLSGETYTLVFPQSGELLDLNLSLDITHTWVGDLGVRLRHNESALEVQLVDRPGRGDSGFGSSADDMNIILDDEAGATVEDGAPFTIGGSYSPNEPLSTFDGIDANGTWVLTITDAATGDTGTLNSWCLEAEILGSVGFKQLVISDPVASEDDSVISFPYTLSGTSTTAGQFDYTTEDNSATAGLDYTSASNTVVVPTSATSGTIEVTLLTDEVVEPNETFILRLNNPQDIILLDVQAIATLLDASPPLLIWLDSFGLGYGDLLVDNDLDGLKTLIEFGFNLNPIVSDRVIYNPNTPLGGGDPVGLPLIEPFGQGGATQLKIVYPRRKASTGAALTYINRFGSDFSSWINPGPDSVESLNSEWEKVTVTDPLDLDTAPGEKRFGQVEVERD